MTPREMTLQELRARLVGAMLYWHNETEDSEGVIFSIYADTNGVIGSTRTDSDEEWYIILIKSSWVQVRLDKHHLATLATTGQTSHGGSTYRVDTPTATAAAAYTHGNATATADNVAYAVHEGNDGIDWEQRTWQLATRLYCQAGDSNERIYARALHAAQAFVDAYRKAMEGEL